jgi:hypothetical protein
LKKIRKKNKMLHQRGFRFPIRSNDSRHIVLYNILKKHFSSVRKTELSLKWKLCPDYTAFDDAYATGVAPLQSKSMGGYQMIA